MEKVKGIIFDLDGVIVDTARLHSAAWKRLAEDIGVKLSEEVAIKQRGIDRMNSLELLLQSAGITGIKYEEKLALAEKKNRYYLEYVKYLSRKDLLEGALDALQTSQQSGYQIALGSASKNAEMVLKSLDIFKYFNFVVDPRNLSSKPHPDIFLTAARGLGLPPKNCVVFEDSYAGLKAANTAKMNAVGIGKLQDFEGLSFETVIPSLLYWSFIDMKELVDHFI
ncbi:beta-phosphoglucomutase [Bacillus sp. BR_7a]|uniref:beta-phosphoglucomutase n=1 Tax=Bacillus sp. BR_7a TaxID=3055775 RepID=UPI003656A02A